MTGADEDTLMHSKDTKRWQHDHVFAQDRVRPGEIRTR